MLYIIHKITNKQVHQITFCTISKATNSELIPGLFFNKIQETKQLVEVPAEKIIENFSHNEDLLFMANESRYFAYKNIGNLDLIIETVKEANANLHQQIFKNESLSKQK